MHIAERKRTLWKGVAALAVALILTVALAGQTFAATVITVCASGCDHTTIQAAVAAATPGDTVQVGDGTYNENVTINKDITLVSENGRGSTTIEGISSAPQLGTIFVTGSTSAVQIGDVGQGFTIIGIDSANPASERAAIYFQGSHSGTEILDNEIRANGEHGLISSYASPNSGFVISGNEFSGKTFVGANPAGSGFGSQFSLFNVPRQLLVMGNGAAQPPTTTNITVTDNEFTGTAGGLNTSGQEQGNTLATIDAANSTISGNTFAGETTRFGHALRVRQPGTTIEENTFDSSRMTLGTEQLFLQNNTVPLEDIVAVNDFDRGAFQNGTFQDLSVSVGGGVARAAAGSDVTVLPGTYDEPKILIDKPLSIQGAGPGQSIIDGNGIDGTLQIGNIRITALGDVEFSGFTVRDSSSRNASSEHLAIVAAGPVAAPAGTTYTLSNVHVEGRGVGGTDRGFYADQNHADLVLDDIEVTNTDFSAVGIEEQRGSSLVQNSFLEPGHSPGQPAYFNWSISPPTSAFSVTEPQIFTGNTVEGGTVAFFTSIAGSANRDGSFTGDIEVTDNEITGIPENGYGVLISNRGAGSGADGAIEDPVITGNSITGRGASVTGTAGVRLSGLVADANVSANTIIGAESGIELRNFTNAATSADHSPTGATASHNRIFGNGVGADNEVAGTLAAENNWWGCNEGPNNDGCDTTAGDVASDPWLTLGISATPEDISVGGASDIEASLVENSDGDQTGQDFPDGTQIDFAANKGSVSPAQAPTSDGLANTAFTSDDKPGAKKVTASLDAETVEIKVHARPTPPAPGGPGGPGDPKGKGKGPKGPKGP